MARRAITSWLICALLSVVTGTAFLGATALAQKGGNPNPGVLPTNSKAHGKTYGEWGDAWTNWAFQFPTASSPLLDETGQFGGQDQTGSVWFLAGNFGGTTVRQLTIPTGKALFFPLFTSVAWVPVFGNDEAEVRANAASDVAAVSALECTIDGVPLRNLFAYRASSSPGGFVFQIPADSLATDFGFDAGDFPAVTDGYWLLLSPLSPGSHQIQFHVESPNFGGGFSDVTYNLTVQAGKR